MTIRDGTPMKPIVDGVLFLAWISVYLLMVIWAGRYRRARVHAIEGWGKDDYRADKDVILRLTVLLIGVLLLFLMYLATKAVSYIL